MRVKTPNVKRQAWRRPTKLVLRSLRDTERLAHKLASTLRGGQVIALVGPLGTGKTTFVQALARALGVKRNVRSPSFIVVQVHKTNVKTKIQNAKLPRKSKNLTLCHVDAYRLKDERELDALGLADYLGDPHTITIIEWADKIKKALPRNTIWLTFSLTEQERSVKILGLT